MSKAYLQSRDIAFPTFDLKTSSGFQAEYNIMPW